MLNFINKNTLERSSEKNLTEIDAMKKEIPVQNNSSCSTFSSFVISQVGEIDRIEQKVRVNQFENIN